MSLLQATDFFDLECYEHRSLFDNCQHVWEALGNLSSYLETFSYSPLTSSYPGVVFVNPEKISIGLGTVIEPGAYIEGPCIIGKGCQVRHGAYLRQNVITGDQCVIGHCTELKNVILLNKVHLAHLAYGGDSIYGNGCNLGAGVKCANLKLNGAQVIVHCLGNRYETGRRKLGAVIGDGGQLGCNSVTNPGTLLGKFCQIYPCTNFGGFAPAESIIRLEAKAVITSKSAIQS